MKPAGAATLEDIGFGDLSGAFSGAWEILPPVEPDAAQLIVRHLGVGGFAFVRTPWLAALYGAARKQSMSLGRQQCFRDGVSMHRITRTK